MLTDPFSKQETKYLECLVRRRDYLAGRIADQSSRHLSYDEAEVAALSWAIEAIREARA